MLARRGFGRSFALGLRMASSGVVDGLDDKRIPPCLEVEEGKSSIVEGAATVVFPGTRESVFYNPVQVLNRDLSTAVVRVWDSRRRARLASDERLLRREMRKRSMREGASMRVGEDGVPGLEIFEGLSASGLRSMRYAFELPRIGRLVVNDLESSAVEAIRANVALNGLDESVVQPHRGNAISVMEREPNAFDVVDLDPYGTPAPFLDSAVRCIKSGGLLCVTATDMITLAGSNTHVAYPRYFGIPVKAGFVHEQSLRLLTQTVASACARHRRVVVPLLSISADFYIRLFLEIHDSASHALDLPLRLANVGACTQCPTFYLQPLGRLRPVRSNAAKKVTKPGEKRPREEDPDDMDTDEDLHLQSKRPKAEETSSISLKKSSISLKKSSKHVCPGNAGLEDVQHLGSAALLAGKSLSNNGYRVMPAPAHPWLGAGGTCGNCGSSVLLGGPIWTGPLFEPEFVKQVSAELNMASELTKEDAPYANGAFGFPVDDKDLWTTTDARGVFFEGERLAGDAETPKKDVFSGGGVSASSPPKKDIVSGGGVSASSPPKKDIASGGKSFPPPSKKSESASAPLKTGQDSSPRKVLVGLESGTAQDAGSNPVSRVRESRKRLSGLLFLMANELVDVPLYYNVDHLFSTVKLMCPTRFDFVRALGNLGYRASTSHCGSSFLKTDAPPGAIWSVVRAFAAQQDALPSKPPSPSAAYLPGLQVPHTILSADPSWAHGVPHETVDLDTHNPTIASFQDAKTSSRFMPNPAALWGPASAPKSRPKSKK